MPADPPRVLDDAVGLDAALIARQATEYDALSGDLTGGTCVLVGRTKIRSKWPADSLKLSVARVTM